MQKDERSADASQRDSVSRRLRVGQPTMYVAC